MWFNACNWRVTSCCYIKLNYIYYCLLLIRFNIRSDSVRIRNDGFLHVLFMTDIYCLSVDPHRTDNFHFVQHMHGLLLFRFFMYLYSFLCFWIYIAVIFICFKVTWSWHRIKGTPSYYCCLMSNNAMFMLLIVLVIDSHVILYPPYMICLFVHNGPVNILSLFMKGLGIYDLNNA